MKKTLAALLAPLLCFALLPACSGSTSATSTDEEATTQTEQAADVEQAEEAEPDTGDASLDDPRNADDIGDNELLVVSFGTSFNDSRRQTIGAIEQALEDAFPDWDVRRGFTSQIIIDHVKSRDGEVIDNVEEALARATKNDVKNLVVQPTHLMHGYEYNDLVDEVGKNSDAFQKVAVGEPLLTSDEDFERVAQAVADSTTTYDDGKTAIVLMGHGTEAESNEVYARMQKVFDGLGKTHYFVGTVEATPSLDDVIAAVKKGDYQRVVLEPLMIVAGDHANNDMASDDDDSWKSRFEAEGYEVECVLRGLGELEPIQQIFAEHAQAAVDSVKGSTEKSKVADASQMAKPVELNTEGLTPMTADALVNGTYAIDVESSSSMFRITACELTVAEGAMTARMTMGGTGYLYVYPGTAEEAAAASEADYITYEEVDGAHTFTIPVAALDEPLPCAAYSKKKEQWYDRELLFRSDSLPAEAFAEGAASKGSSVESLGLENGTYNVDVTLEGGSGKASVDSPALITVADGAAVARIVWSSPNYDYMLVDGERLEPVNEDGNSAFDVPVSAFDTPLPVVADTTAMSTPHEIEYTLTFDSSTITTADA